LAGRLDAVYHAGAAVNFVSPYETLRAANVGGTHEILSLASLVRRKPVHFISSLAVFSLEEQLALQTVREEAVPAHWQGLHIGYAQSKWVAERLVLLAGSRGLPVVVYRPGLITGHSRTGVGNLSDFVSRSIQACIQIGAAPDMDMTVDMTPVDYVSGAVVRLARRPASPGQVYHLVNARQLPWNRLVEWVRAYGYPLRHLPYNRWRDELLAHPEFSPENALYLLSPLFSALPGDGRLSVPEMRFDARNAQAGLAGTGVACPPVDERLLETYFDTAVRRGVLQAPRAEGRLVAEVAGGRD
jgi:thioester reductase-like protein